MIYVNLVGRIGNQLFIYAMAEALRQKRGGKEKIVFCDDSILALNWLNCLPFYNIPYATYLHSYKKLPLKIRLKGKICGKFYQYIAYGSYWKKYKREKWFRYILSLFGIVCSENGYIDFPKSPARDIYMQGYFQSEKYFSKCADLIKSNLRLTLPLTEKNVNLVNKITSRNTVCISIKVEHNVGSQLYDVCGMDYYKKAIAYIMEHVENPLFFICSDNVEFVVNNLIDTKNVDYICQDSSMGVHENIQIMSYCKHFILSNSTYAWWGQYLCNYPEKIVIAPNHWMRVDMPIDIYQDNWILIDVTDYCNCES